MNKIITAIVGVVVIGALVTWIILSKKEEVVPNAMDIARNDIAAPGAHYRDGSYTVGGTYQSPAGREDIDITLVIENDTVIDAVFVGKTVNPTSTILQGMFAQGFKGAVIGKRVDDLSLTVVNGSSLTPKGFNDALAKIKAQALTQE